ncbi:(2Fe-2S)-binding protein [Paenisporosarcina indica]|uniref:(2Fe-2S)-binding protein n=1 Tax=Paenisporosarcina indica TaxID=650093 RepID=UPI001FE96B59|nr:(2Fe-2S)-binding protein [Paenisporosarcina indica]
MDKLTLSELFNESIRDQHIIRLMTEFGSPSRAHAVSMTVKRIGYMAALMIYARIKHSVLISPNECKFITIYEESSKASWQPVYSFPLETAERGLSTVEWITRELYAKTLVPLIELFAKEKGISRVVLFENIYTYMKWIFISKLQDDLTFQQLNKTPASDYGLQKQHPLALYECGPSASRKTCCLYYQTQGAVKPCKTCPL